MEKSVNIKIKLSSVTYIFGTKTVRYFHSDLFSLIYNEKPIKVPAIYIEYYRYWCSLLTMTVPKYRIHYVELMLSLEQSDSESISNIYNNNTSSHLTDELMLTVVDTDT